MAGCYSEMTSLTDSTYEAPKFGEIHACVEDQIIRLVADFRAWPETSVKWYKENFELKNGSKYEVVTQNSVTELVIRNLSKSDSGSYTVVASSLTGEALLNSELIVEDSVGVGYRNHGETHLLPSILVQPLADQVIRVGTKARFTVAASYPPDPRVHWYKGNDIFEDNERFQVSRQGGVCTLDIMMVEPSDDGVWKCEVITSYGYATTIAYLHAIVPKGYRKPEFLEGLKAMLTEQGTVSLECKVVGVPTPLLKWFKDGKEIKAGDMFNLRVQSDDENSLGTYSCVAINCMGKAVSCAQVTVMDKTEDKFKPKLKSEEPLPYFIEHLENKTIRVGENCRLTVRVRTPPPAQVTWYNKDQAIDQSKKYSFSQLEDSIFHLDIAPIENSDEGEWRCIASSQYGQTISSAYLTLIVPKNYRSPEFVEDLQAIFTDDGLVSFECKVVGVPTPVLRWYKDGLELKPGDVHQLSGTSSLGSYSCVAKNCMGSASSIAELTLEDIYCAKEKRRPPSRYPPCFIEHLKNETCIIGDNFTFTVSVSCPPIPEVTWYKDNIRICESSKIHLQREKNGVYHMTISNLENSDQGSWKCLAVNDYGHTLTQCVLKVIVPKHYKKPKFIENLRAVLSEEGTVSLECKVVGVPQPVLKWYKDGIELKAGDIYKIISGEGGTSSLGTYTCEAQNCMGTATSTAALLAFDDRYLQDRVRRETYQNELSTIEEKDEFSTYGTPSLTDNWDESKAEMEFSIYETPDITEDEARQIVEMFADEVSEYVSMKDASELPPLRFIKESAYVGNILMEALIIDVPLDYCSKIEDLSQRTPVENLATEADIMDISTMDPVVVDLPYDYSEAASLHELKLDFSEGGEVVVKETSMKEAIIVETTQDYGTQESLKEAFDKRSAHQTADVKQPVNEHLIETSSIPFQHAEELIGEVNIRQSAGQSVTESHEGNALQAAVNIEQTPFTSCNEQQFLDVHLPEVFDERQQPHQDMEVEDTNAQRPTVEYGDVMSEDISQSDNLGTEADVESIASLEEFASDLVNGFSDEPLETSILAVPPAAIIIDDTEQEEGEDWQLQNEREVGRTPTFEVPLEATTGEVDKLINEADYLGTTPTPTPHFHDVVDESWQSDGDMFHDPNLSSPFGGESSRMIHSTAGRQEPGLLAELASSVLHRAAEGIMTTAVIAESLVAAAASMILPLEEQLTTSEGLSEEQAFALEEKAAQKQMIDIEQAELLMSEARSSVQLLTIANTSSSPLNASIGPALDNSTPHEMEMPVSEELLLNGKNDASVTTEDKSDEINAVSADAMKLDNASKTEFRAEELLSDTCQSIAAVAVMSSPFLADEVELGANGVVDQPTVGDVTVALEDLLKTDASLKEVSNVGDVTVNQEQLQQHHDVEQDNLPNLVVDSQEAVSLEHADGTRVSVIEKGDDQNSSLATEEFQSPKETLADTRELEHVDQACQESEASFVSVEKDGHPGANDQQTPVLHSSDLSVTVDADVDETKYANLKEVEVGHDGKLEDSLKEEQSLSAARASEVTNVCDSVGEDQTTILNYKTLEGTVLQAVEQMLHEESGDGITESVLDNAVQEAISVSDYLTDDIKVLPTEQLVEQSTEQQHHQTEEIFEGQTPDTDQVLPTVGDGCTQQSLVDFEVVKPSDAQTEEVPAPNIEAASLETGSKLESQEEANQTLLEALDQEVDPYHIDSSVAISDKDNALECTVENKTLEPCSSSLSQQQSTTSVVQETQSEKWIHESAEVQNNVDLQKDNCEIGSHSSEGALFESTEDNRLEAEFQEMPSSIIPSEENNLEETKELSSDEINASLKELKLDAVNNDKPQRGETECSVVTQITITSEEKTEQEQQNHSDTLLKVIEDVNKNSDADIQSDIVTPIAVQELHALSAVQELQLHEHIETACDNVITESVVENLEGMTNEQFASVTIQEECDALHSREPKFEIAHQVGTSADSCIIQDVPGGFQIYSSVEHQENKFEDGSNFELASKVAEDTSSFGQEYQIGLERELKDSESGSSLGQESKGAESGSAGGQESQRVECIESGNSFGQQSKDVESGSSLGQQSKDVESGSSLGHESKGVESGSSLCQESKDVESGSSLGLEPRSAESGSSIGEEFKIVESDRTLEKESQRVESVENGSSLGQESKNVESGSSLGLESKGVESGSSLGLESKSTESGSSIGQESKIVESESTLGKESQQVENVENGSSLGQESKDVKGYSCLGQKSKDVKSDSCLGQQSKDVESGNSLGQESKDMESGNSLGQESKDMESGSRLELESTSAESGSSIGQESKIIESDNILGKESQLVESVESGSSLGQESKIVVGGSSLGPESQQVESVENGSSLRQESQQVESVKSGSSRGQESRDMESGSSLGQKSLQVESVKSGSSLGQESKDTEIGSSLGQESKDVESGGSLGLETKSADSGSSLGQESQQVENVESGSSLGQESQQVENVESGSSLGQESKDMESGSSLGQESKDVESGGSSALESKGADGGSSLGQESKIVEAGSNLRQEYQLVDSVESGRMLEQESNSVESGCSLKRESQSAEIGLSSEQEAKSEGSESCSALEHETKVDEHTSSSGDKSEAVPKTKPDVLFQKSEEISQMESNVSKMDNKLNVAIEATVDHVDECSASQLSPPMTIPEIPESTTQTADTLAGDQQPCVMESAECQQLLLESIEEGAISRFDGGVQGVPMPLPESLISDETADIQKMKANGDQLNEEPTCDTIECLETFDNKVQEPHPDGSHYGDVSEILEVKESALNHESESYTFSVLGESGEHIIEPAVSDLAELPVSSLILSDDTNITSVSSRIEMGSEALTVAVEETAEGLEDHAAFEKANNLKNLSKQKIEIEPERLVDDSGNNNNNNEVFETLSAITLEEEVECPFQSSPSVEAELEVPLTFEAVFVSSEEALRCAAEFTAESLVDFSMQDALMESCSLAEFKMPLQDDYYEDIVEEDTIQSSTPESPSVKTIGFVEELVAKCILDAFDSLAEVLAALEKEFPDDENHETDYVDQGGYEICFQSDNSDILCAGTSQLEGPVSVKDETGHETQTTATECTKALLENVHKEKQLAECSVNQALEQNGVSKDGQFVVPEEKVDGAVAETAKENIPQHLLDEVDSAAEFVRDAKIAVEHVKDKESVAVDKDGADEHQDQFASSIMSDNASSAIHHPEDCSGLKDNELEAHQSSDSALLPSECDERKNQQPVNNGSEVKTTGCEDVSNESSDAVIKATEQAVAPEIDRINLPVSEKDTDNKDVKQPEADTEIKMIKEVETGGTESKGRQIEVMPSISYQPDDLMDVPQEITDCITPSLLCQARLSEVTVEENEMAKAEEYQVPRVLRNAAATSHQHCEENLKEQQEFQEPKHPDEVEIELHKNTDISNVIANLEMGTRQDESSQGTVVCEDSSKSSVVQGTDDGGVNLDNLGKSEVEHSCEELHATRETKPEGEMTTQGHEDSLQNAAERGVENAVLAKVESQGVLNRDILDESIQQLSPTVKSAEQETIADMLTSKSEMVEEAKSAGDDNLKKDAESVTQDKLQKVTENEEVATQHRAEQDVCANVKDTLVSQVSHPDTVLVEKAEQIERSDVGKLASKSDIVGDRKSLDDINLKQGSQCISQEESKEVIENGMCLPQESEKKECCASDKETALSQAVQVPTEPANLEAGSESIPNAEFPKSEGNKESKLMRSTSRKLKKRKSSKKSDDGDSSRRRSYRQDSRDSSASELTDEGEDFFSTSTESPSHQKKYSRTTSGTDLCKINEWEECNQESDKRRNSCPNVGLLPDIKEHQVCKDNGSIDDHSSNNIEDVTSSVHEHCVVNGEVVPEDVKQESLEHSKLVTSDAILPDAKETCTPSSTPAEQAIEAVINSCSAVQNDVSHSDVCNEIKEAVPGSPNGSSDTKELSKEMTTDQTISRSEEHISRSPDKTNLNDKQRASVHTANAESPKGEKVEEVIATRSQEVQNGLDEVSVNGGLQEPSSRDLFLEKSGVSAGEDEKQPAKQETVEDKSEVQTPINSVVPSVEESKDSIPEIAESATTTKVDHPENKLPVNCGIHSILNGDLDGTLSEGADLKEKSREETPLRGDLDGSSSENEDLAEMKAKLMSSAKTPSNDLVFEELSSSFEDSTSDKTPMNIVVESFSEDSEETLKADDDLVLPDMDDSIMEIEEIPLDDISLEDVIENVRALRRLQTILEVDELTDEDDSQHIVIAALSVDQEEEDSSSKRASSLQPVEKQQLVTVVDDIRRSSSGDLPTKARRTKDAPHFVMKLQDLTIPVGYRMRLTCCVIGSPEPKVRWLKNGRPITSEMGYREINDFGICILEVPRASHGDSGEYTCVAKNQHGEDSTTSHLFVRGKSKPELVEPAFTRSILDMKGHCGDSITMDCMVIGWPTPAVSWFKNDKPLEVDDRMEIRITSGRTHRLVIREAILEDSGIYRCVAKNSLGKDEITASIKIMDKSSYKTSRFVRDSLTRRLHSESEYSAASGYSSGSSSNSGHLGEIPRFISELEDKTAHLGSTITFQCEVTGRPKPDITWLHNGKLLTQSNHIKFSQQDNAFTLMILDSSYSDLGMYTCQATNGMGTGYTSACLNFGLRDEELEFGLAPVFITKPTSIAVGRHEEIVLSCKIDGRPRPRVTWLKGARDMSLSRRAYKDSKGNIHKLIIHRAMNVDDGEYIIEARNKNGKEVAKCTVTVEQNSQGDGEEIWDYHKAASALNILRGYRPYVPRKELPGPIAGEPKVTDTGRNWVTLVWPRPIHDGGSSILAYRIEACELPGNSWEEVGLSPITICDVYNLKPESKYIFRVSARNMVGWSPPVSMGDPMSIARRPDIPHFTSVPPSCIQTKIGATVSLKCLVSGKPGPKIRWYKDGEPIDLSRNHQYEIAFDGLTSSLIIGNVLEADEGCYMCEAISDGGRATAFTVVALGTLSGTSNVETDSRDRLSRYEEVDSPPKFPMRLRDRNVAVNNMVRLTCQAQGSPSPTITWLKDGFEIKPSERIVMTSDGSFHTLEICRAQDDDNGIYTVFASNNLGSVSCKSKLTVGGDVIRSSQIPTFSKELEDVVVTIGNSTTLICKIGYPGWNSTWFKDGQKIYHSRKCRIRQLPDGTCILTFAHVSSSDSGIYTCVAYNESGRCSTTCKLKVGTEDSSRDGSRQLMEGVSGASSHGMSKAPIFLKKPRSTEVVEFDSVELVCEVIGDPKPEVLWLRDGLTFKYQKDPEHFIRVGDGPLYRLEISSVTIDDTGTYAVIAHNCHGETKAIISLQVFARGQGIEEGMPYKIGTKAGKVATRPEVLQLLKDMHCADGDSVTFECHIDASPIPEIRWEKDGHVIQPSEDFHISQEGRICRLKITEIFPEDDGEYVCVAYNEAGKVSTGARLTVKRSENKENGISSTGMADTGGLPQRPPRKRVVAEPTVKSKKKMSGPRFLTHPHNRVVDEGDTVKFTCSIAGNPEPMVQWEKLGRLIKSTGRILLMDREDVHSLIIQDVTPSDAGLYTVTLSNSVGKVYATAKLDVVAKRKGKSAVPISAGGLSSKQPSKSSRVLSVTAFEVPKILNPLSDLAVHSGDRVFMSCGVSGKPKPKITWNINGEPVHNNKNCKMKFDGQIAALTINCLEKYPKETVVTCMASNPLGCTHSSAKLTVKGHPWPKSAQRRVSPPVVVKRIVIPDAFKVDNGSQRPDSVQTSVEKRKSKDNNVKTKMASSGIESGVSRLKSTNGSVIRNGFVKKPDLGLTVVNGTARISALNGEKRCRSAIQEGNSSSNISSLEPNPTLVKPLKASTLKVSSVTVPKNSRTQRTLNNKLDGPKSCDVTHTKVPAGSQQEELPPSFIKGLEDVYVKDGQNVTLFVQISGSEPFEVVWVRNDQEIKDCNATRYINSDNNQFSLVIADIFPEDSGIYTCEVYNMYGHEESSCTVHFQGPNEVIESSYAAPKLITSLPDIVDAVDGKPFQLSVEISGKPTPVIEWFKDGRKLLNFIRIKTYSDGNRHICDFSRVRLRDGGIYLVMATNCVGKVTSSTSLNVKGLSPDHVTSKLEFNYQQIQNGRTPATDNADEMCKSHVREWPEPRRECESTNSVKGPWNLNDDSSQTSTEKSWGDKNPQDIQELRESETIPVKERPAHIIRGPRSTTVLQGQKVTLKVHFIGKPQCSVKWIKGGKIVERSDRIRMDTCEDVSSLTLENVTSDDSGKYIVVVENSQGADCHFASVSVEGPPSPPASKPLVSQVTDSSVTLCWYGSPYDGGSVITGYIVEICRLGDTNWQTVTSNCHSTSYIVKGLEPGSKWLFRLRAQNVHGVSCFGQESDVVEIKDELDTQCFEDVFDDDTHPSQGMMIEDGIRFNDDYEIKEELGKGKFGRVYRVIRKSSQEEFAGKFIRCIKSKDKEKVLEEIEVMKELRHPKLLRLTAAFENSKEMILVMEYISGGELFERVVAEDFELTERDCILFTRQICEGVRYMHDLSFMHLDLKPENILCLRRDSHQIKLIDFGLAKKYDPQNPLRVMFGTPEFVAPEVINYETISPASDMWSVGVICYVLLSGLSPFLGDNDNDTFSNITRCLVEFDDEAFDAISDLAKEFISNLLVKNKSKRFSALECLRHPWLAQQERTMSSVRLCTDKLKKFIVRRKWQILQTVELPPYEKRTKNPFWQDVVRNHTIHHLSNIPTL